MKADSSSSSSSSFSFFFISVSTGRKYSTTLWKMQEDLKAINHTITPELAALQQNETNNVKTLQKVEQMVKNLTKEAKKVKSQFQDQIKKLQGTLQRLKCDLEDTKHKGTGPERGCCSWGWHLFQQSCYWLSSAEKSWPEAKQDCEEKQAHLVIITSYLEKQFVFRLTKPNSVWIGLEFTGHMWSWVDWTPYIMSRTDWLSYETDFHRYCAVTYRGRLWDKTDCHFRFRWMCEMQALR
ncbi:asialoglycoprotein receptor 1-like [Crotalus adamanteus]|uniref:Asialoglycoprotein receptor 1-like n=1 Tax=Crotalus adamanteus TaxID=8729 RepID=A0AAW1B8D3_CROAD